MNSRIIKTNLSLRFIALLFIANFGMLISISECFAQDANFQTPLNNKTFFHPSHIGILRGVEGGIYSQTIFFGVRPNPINNHAFISGSYKIGKGFYCGQGLSVNYDGEGASPRISTTSIKLNAVNIRWFYRKHEKINCDNYYTLPNVSMGYYLGVFNKSINNGEMIFSKQIVDWTQNPISTANPELFQSVTKPDFGGSVAIQFPISKLFIFNNDFWIGNFCYSMHHMQSTGNDKPTEASFIVQNQNVVLPRYQVMTFSLLNKNNLHKEIFVQYEKQQPVRRYMAGINFFINPQIAFTVTGTSHNIGKWSRNINSLIFTANMYTKRKEIGRDLFLTKFYISYASVITGIGISPFVNRFGSLQIGFKFSRNKGCNLITTGCPSFII